MPFCSALVRFNSLGVVRVRSKKEKDEFNLLYMRRREQPWTFLREGRLGKNPSTSFSLMEVWDTSPVFRGKDGLPTDFQVPNHLRFLRQHKMVMK